MRACLFTFATTSFSREASKYHKGIPHYPRKICKYLQEYLTLPGCFEFVLQIIIQNTSTSHAKRQNFNRAPNFVSVSWLCTIQNTSFSQAKAHLRTPFLQNSFQWLLSNISYFFRKGKTKKLFHTSRSSRPEVFLKISQNSQEIRGRFRWGCGGPLQSLVFLPSVWRTTYCVYRS